MTLIGITLALVPGIAWLLFFLKEDLHPEPKWLIGMTFLSGIAFGFYALQAEKIAVFFLPQNREAPLAVSTLVVFALIEEVFKFLAAYLIVRKNQEFDEPVDAMIYAVVAGLGFATLENFGAITLSRPAQTAVLSEVFEIASLRFVGATLLHSLTAALMGYYWAVSVRDFGAKRFIFLGIGIATALHALFNFFIIEYNVMAYPLLLVLFIGFFVIGDFEKLKRKTI